MFGKDKKETSNIDIPSIILTTTESIPGKNFSILDIIFLKIDDASKDLSSIKVALNHHANKIGADAVLGIKLTQESTRATGGPIIVTGTAIKFID